eukprot:TRINITY_DN1583_c0_g1_i2.p1 TRINITY_DN1583_c0_g1~~TRINITY_DN1583_c0_g1_i2.p1  ORF type:complete len:233 (+),score=111.15 TRINITY_DN1583_c0_g1_i2:90-701(+)
MAERAICPNSYNPRDWFLCTSAQDCMSNNMQEVARLASQPVTLKCVNGAVCDTSAQYFLKNVTDYGDDLSVLCFFAYNSTASELCLPPIRLDTASLHIQPIPSQVYPMSEDECGYYFFPYEVLRLSNAKYGGFFINDFPIVWHEQSYVANAAKYPTLDYSWVVSSSGVQTQKQFSGPYPNLRLMNALLRNKNKNQNSVWRERV